MQMIQSTEITTYTGNLDWVIRDNFSYFSLSPFFGLGSEMKLYDALHSIECHVVS